MGEKNNICVSEQQEDLGTCKEEASTDWELESASKKKKKKKSKCKGDADPHVKEGGVELPCSVDGFANGHENEIRATDLRGSTNLCRKKKKKEKKHPADNLDTEPIPSSLEIQDGEIENAISEKKQKKKKRKAKDIGNTDEDSSSPTKKAKCFEETNLLVEPSAHPTINDLSGSSGSEPTMESSTREIKKKKKKKCRENEVTTATDNMEVTDKMTTVERKDREASSAATTSTEPEKKKKKKKKKDKETRGTPDKTIDTKRDSAAKDEQKAGMQSDVGGNAVVSSYCKQEKNGAKKRKKESEEAICEQQHQENSADEPERKKKKKRKKSLDTDATTENGLHLADDQANPEQNLEFSRSKKKKEKKCSHDRDIQMERNDGMHEWASPSEEPKKKKKRSKREDTTDTPASAHTTDNTPPLERPSDDKVRVKKVKDKKKPADGDKQETSSTASVDSNSGKTVMNSSEGGSTDAVFKCVKDEPLGNGTGKNGEMSQIPDKRFGQWNTTMFESNERQDKFLRLLGGMKKNSTPGAEEGLFGSLKASPSLSVGGQSALTYDKAQIMNKRLEFDFERALTFSCRSQRGVGLGFQPDPEEGKKFYIDINKSASTKFDD